MKDKIEELLQAKFESFVEKYIEARKIFLNKQLEIIKGIDPSFQGTVSDFFDSHTLASRSTDHEKKYYDIASHRYVNYDFVDGDIGFMFDDMGKQVHSQSRRTREYLMFEYYSKIAFSLMSMLGKVQSLDKKNPVYISETAPVRNMVQEVQEELPPQGPKL